MPPGIAQKPPIKKEIKKEVEDKEKENVKKAVEAQQANPEAPLKGLEQSLGLTPTSEFLTGSKPAERAKEKVSGDGDDDEGDGDEEDKQDYY